MKQMIFMTGAIALCAAGAQAQDADEQEVDVLTHMSLVAGESLDAALSRNFDKAQIEMLKSVAHQQVVASKCDGFEIDPSKYRAEMNRIYYTNDGEQIDVTPEQLHQHEKLAMMGFGLALGSQLTIAAYDHDAFCAHAVEERDVEDDTHIIYADAE